MASINAPKIDVYSEDEARTLARELQALTQVATYCDNLSVALKQRLVIGLRNEGIDGGGWLATKTLGTNAERAADKIVQPLRAIGAECYSAGQAAVAFDRLFQQLYVEPIAAARAMKKDPRGGGVKVNA